MHIYSNSGDANKKGGYILYPSYAANIFIHPVLPSEFKIPHNGTPQPSFPEPIFMWPPCIYC